MKITPVKRKEKKKQEKLLDDLYKYFADQNKTSCFNPFDERSVLINAEKDFEEMCTSMEEGGFHGVNQITVFEFYSKVQYLEKKAQRARSELKKTVMD